MKTDLIEEAVEAARLKFAEILLHKNLFDVTFGEILVSDCREAMRAALLAALRKIEPTADQIERALKGGETKEDQT